jgi:DNA-binding MarR family transcriptional regulator
MPPKPPKPAPSASVDGLLAAYAEALPRAAPSFAENEVWGNADLLVHQWKRELPKTASNPLLMGIRIRRIGMLLDKLIIDECSAQGIKHSEFILLMALRRIGQPNALRPTDILRMHSVTSGTATYRIDQLVKQDLAERLPDPNDRRGYLISLTPRGQEVVDAVLGRLGASFKKHLAPFDQVPHGFAALEAGLRLFETCLELLEEE